MAILGITGGIACGKSVFADRLVSLVGWGRISADAIARRLLDEEEPVQREIVGRLGRGVLDGNLGLDRARLRELVFSDSARRKELEEILHPRIRSEWTRVAREAREDGRGLLVEIPLLFETGAEKLFDETVVVAAPRETQLKRLWENRGIIRETGERMIEAQMPLPEKVRRGDRVVWNAGGLPGLDAQARLLAGALLATGGEARRNETNDGTECSR